MVVADGLEAGERERYVRLAAGAKRPAHLILVEAAKDQVQEDDRVPLNDLRRALDSAAVGEEGFRTALRLGGQSLSEVKRLVFRALPRFSVVLPMYDISRALGIYDTTFALAVALVAINQPFTIWLLRNFFAEIPRELDEAAMIDGCTRIGMLRRVMIPLMRPGILTAGIFVFLFAFQEYLTALVLTDSSSKTVPVFIATQLGQTLPMLQQAGAASLLPFAAFLSPERGVDALEVVLAVAAGTHLLLVWTEITLPHVTAHARLATKEMTKGRFGRFFRLGIITVAVAVAAPLIGVLAVPFALIGLLAHEHAYVQAGQSVPLA